MSFGFDPVIEITLETNTNDATKLNLGIGGKFKSSNDTEYTLKFVGRAIVGNITPLSAEFNRIILERSKKDHVNRNFVALASINFVKNEYCNCAIAAGIAGKYPDKDRFLHYRYFWSHTFFPRTPTPPARR